MPEHILEMIDYQGTQEGTISKAGGRLQQEGTKGQNMKTT